MKKKNLYVMTFMSWENEFEEGLRAIALCGTDGFFYEAINCVRDSDMGEKDENGVYGRIWYGDNVECYGNELDTLRPATQEEVELYLKYVPLEDAIGNKEGMQEENLRLKVVHISKGRYSSCVVVEYEYKREPWWRKLFATKQKNPF